MTAVAVAAEARGATVKASAVKARRLDKAGKIAGTLIFHAGTSTNDTGETVATGGRVLNVTANGDSIAQAHERAYKAVERIDWPGGFCRRDIGWQAI